MSKNWKKIPEPQILTAIDASKLQAALAGSAAFERMNPSDVPFGIPSRMPGFKEAYISRSFDETEIGHALEFGGKLVLSRFAENKNKNYAYGFAFSGSGEVVFWSYPKDKQLHHEPSGSKPSVEKVANRADIPDL